MSFKQYLKLLLQLIPIFLLMLVVGIGISFSPFKWILFPVIYFIIFPFIMIKYTEWIINKFY